MAGRGQPPPDYVQQESESYLKCGHLEHGFQRVRCDTCYAAHPVNYVPRAPVS